MPIGRGKYYYIDRRLPVIGRLFKTLETQDSHVAAYREGVIRGLADRGRFDLLRNLVDGMYSVAELVDAVEHGTEHQLLEYRGNPKLADVIDAFVAEKGKEIRTVDRYARSMHAFMRWGATMVADINPSTIEQYKRDTKAKGRKNSGINRDLVALRQFLTWFAGRGAARQVFNDVTMLPPAPRRTRRLTPGEIARLLEATLAPYRVMFIVMLETGLRPSEACRIEWGDIDVINLTLRVKDSKTAAGERLLPISPRLVGLLQNNRVHVSPSELSLAFSRIAKKAGLKDVQLRDLRRTHLQYCRLSDGDVVKQRDQAGHTSVKHTEAYLGESNVEERRPMVEAAVTAMGI